MIKAVIIAAAVIALLLFAPIDLSVYADYDGGGFNSNIKICGIELKKRKKKEKSDKSKTKSKPKSGKKGEKKSVIARLRERIDVELLKYIFGKMNTVLEYVCGRMIGIRKLKLHIIYGGAEPFATGMTFGAISAAVYSALGVIHHNTTINKWDISLKPDFDNPHVYACADCIIRTRIAYIIVAALKLVSVILGIRKVNKQKETGMEA